MREVVGKTVTIIQCGMSATTNARKIKKNANMTENKGEPFINQSLPTLFSALIYTFPPVTTVK